MSPIPKKAARAQDTLEFHPLANAFPLMEGPEFKEFVADIKAHGLREPITLYQGKVMEGRNRYRACLRLKIEPRFTPFMGDDADAHAFVISRNIHRRHLKSKEKREAIAKLLKLHPENSNRQIADAVKADKNTVANVRHELESTGEIHQLKKRVGKDGRERAAKKQKRSKPKGATTAAPATGAGTPATAAPAPTAGESTDAVAPVEKPQSSQPQPSQPQSQPSQPQPQPRGTAVEAGGQPAAPPKPGTPEERNADAKWALEMATSNRDAAVRLLDLLRDKERRVAFVKALAAAITIRPAENAVTAVAPANADK